MKYSIYQLDFYNGVRFGKGRLETTEMTFHADTLFAALFQEAIKLGKEKIFHYMIFLVHGRRNKRLSCIFASN